MATLFGTPTGATTPGASVPLFPLAPQTGLPAPGLDALAGLYGQAGPSYSPAAIAQAQATPPPPPHGLSGFLGNTWKGVEGLATGLGSLIGMGVHDTAKILTGGKLGGNWETEQFVKALPEIPKMYERYYGPLFHGDVKQFGSNVYANPLQVVQDALAAVSLGGSAAATGARMAAQTGEVGALVDTAASEASTAARLGSEAAAATEPVARAAATEASAQALARATAAREAIPPWIRKVLPGLETGDEFLGGSRWVQRGNEMVRLPNDINPWKRFVQTRVTSRLLQTPVADFEAKWAEAKAPTFFGMAGEPYATNPEAASLGTKLDVVRQPGYHALPDVDKALLRDSGVNTYTQLVGKVESLAEEDPLRPQLAEIGQRWVQASPPRMDRAILTGLKTNDMVDRILGSHQQRLLYKREQMTREVQRIVNPLSDADKGALYLGLQNLDAIPADLRDQFAPAVREQLDARIRDSGAVVNSPTLQATLGPRYGDKTFAVDGLPDGPKLRPTPTSPLDPAQHAAIQAELADLGDHVAVRDAAGDPFMGESHAQAIADVVVPTWNDAIRSYGELGKVGTPDMPDAFISTPQENGYRAINVDVTRSDGTVVQVRLHTDRSLRASEQGAIRLKLLDRLQTQLEDLRTNPDTRLSAEKNLALQDQLGNEITAAQRLSKNAFHGVVRELDHQLNGFATSPADMAKEDLRLWTMQRLESQALERGLLKPTAAFERPYYPLMLMTGAERLADGSWKGGLSAYELDDMLQSAGQTAPVYFAHQDASALPKFSDFLLSKAKVGAKKAAGEPYFQPNRGLLFQRGTFETDPVKVYTRRAAQMVRHEETWDMIDEFLRRLGRPIDDTKEVAQSEVLVAPKGLLTFFNSRIALQDWMARATAGDADASDLVGQLKEVMPVIQNEVKNVLSARPSDELWAVPKQAWDRLNAFASPRLGGKARLAFTMPTNVWRNLVLLGSPRWIINNNVGNIVFLKLQGGRISDVLRTLTPEYKAWFETLPEDVKMRLNAGFFSGAEQYNVRAGSSANRLTNLGRAVMSDTKLGRGLSAYKRVYMQLNQASEDAFRQASFLHAGDRLVVQRGIKSTFSDFWKSKDRLEHIAEAGATPEGFNRLVDEVNYFFNDYAKMTPLAKNVIRPFIFPFWSFYRHVFKLVFTMPFTHPARTDLLSRFADLSNDMTAGYGPLPSFLTGDTVLGPGKAMGDVRFLSTRGPSPFNVIQDFPQGLIGNLHPLLKTAYEEVTGRSALSGSDFSASDVVQPFGSKYRFKVTPQGQVQQVNQVRPPLIEELLRQFVPQYQMAEQYTAPGQYYSTSTLPQIIGSRIGGAQPGGPVYTDPATGQPLYPSDLTQRVLGLVGFPTTDYDVANYQSQIAQGEQQALRTYLTRLGILPAASGTVGGGKLFG
jgi:hypothetical protein